MRYSALALVVTLAAVASASFIPFSGRVITPEDVIGTFTGRDFSGLGCPFRIEHKETVAEGGNVIPHSAITHNRRIECDDGEMTIYTDPDTAADAVSDEGTKEFIQNFAASGEPAFYGVEKAGRTCGGTSFSPDTVVILFAPDEPVVLSNIEAFPAGNRYMLIDDPKTIGVCRYSAKPLPVPATPEPTTPEPGVPPGTGPGGDSRKPPGASPSPTDDPDGKPSGGRRPKEQVGETPEETPGETEEEMPSPSPTDEVDGEGDGDGDGDGDDDGSICFPGDAVVKTENGNFKKISDVQIGDRLMVADGVYSDVFMFTHKDASTIHDFVTLSTASGDNISATRGHYLYINGRFTAAAYAKVGDILELGNGAHTTIQRISIEKKVGLFNPQTVHGDLIVNGIRASTFTRTIEPPTAQALLAPLRMMYDVVGLSVSFLNNGADSIAALLPKGQTSL